MSNDKDPGSVLFLSHDASRTGAPIFLLRLLRWFHENESPRCQVLVGRHGELISEFASVAPTECFEPNPTVRYRGLRRVGMHQWLDRRQAAHVRTSLERSGIRLIYANTIVTGEMVERLSFLRCPVICHVHELQGVISGHGSQTVTTIDPYVSRYVAVSNAVKANLIASHGISAERISVIHGFIPAHLDMSKERCRHSLREELGMDESSRIVIGCGSIEDRKGTDLFLEVAANVLNSSAGTPVHFVWLGGRSERLRSMRKQVIALGLQNRIHFLGQKEKSERYFQGSDLFLLTSREDPFPLVMMEAGLCELPVICFDKSGGAAEFIESDAGVVVPAFDVQHMSRATIDLLDAPELRRTLGVTAKQKVLARHEVGVGARQILSVIRQTLKLTECAHCI